MFMCLVGLHCDAILMIDGTVKRSKRFFTVWVSRSWSGLKRCCTSVEYRCPWSTPAVCLQLLKKPFDYAFSDQREECRLLDRLFLHISVPYCLEPLRITLLNCILTEILLTNDSLYHSKPDAPTFQIFIFNFSYAKLSWEVERTKSCTLPFSSASQRRNKSWRKFSGWKTPPMEEEVRGSPADPTAVPCIVPTLS